MAIYNLDYGQLESLLGHSFLPGTENAIIEAIKAAGIVTPSSGPTNSPPWARAHSQGDRR